MKKGRIDERKNRRKEGGKKGRIEELKKVRREKIRKKGRKIVITQPTHFFGETGRLCVLESIIRKEKKLAQGEKLIAIN